jgi:hypothetical protein
MKTPIAAAALYLILAAAGCQPRVAPTTPAAPPAATTGAVGSEPSGTLDGGMPDSDQPDDPGMTTAHDKTLRQELPSGDESSQAAPNEGDAEPPQ